MNERNHRRIDPRAIPQIDALLLRAERSPVAELAGSSRTRLASEIRALVAEVRAEWLRGSGPPQDFFTREDSDGYVRVLARRVAFAARRRHEGVINATGILLHTGLGRAPLSATARDAAEGAGGYAVVEVDPTTGERDFREERCASLLVETTGAEAATVVNNNAAATMLVLAALGAGREAIVSRGELVEIGGGFRMPDVMAASGCILREVGATNRTHTRDFAAAIGESTGLLLKVHTSNFRIVGFTASPPVAELAQLARDAGVPFVYDLGSGLLRGVDVQPLAGEPTVQAAVGSGADVVCFSGDKLLCGPQAGILVGRKALIARVRAHPLFRAMRPGKLELAALEATLLAWRDAGSRESDLPDLPLYEQLALTREELERRAERLRAALPPAVAARAEIVATRGFLGSGSAPAREFAGVALGFALDSVGGDAVAMRLRAGRPRVYTRFEDERLLVELRTVPASELDVLAAALVAAFRAEPLEAEDGTATPGTPVATRATRKTTAKGGKR
jgi:L-seryl-tRNA(Ser) seleniumtransferase